jgi:hypothetical protein
MMLTQQRINGVEQRMAAIKLDLQGMAPGDEMDELLDELWWLMGRMAALTAGLVPNG